jgi:uracil-DNA glycosylase
MRLIELLPKTWIDFLELPDGYFDRIDALLIEEKINPEFKNIFRAFDIDPFSVRVVIVGQDPYPKSEDAIGLAFSVQKSRKNLPGSLRNIKKELESDLGIEFNTNGDLSGWQNQGVLLLNRILTTKSGESLAHKGIGWETFTNLVIEKLAKLNVVFILWGNSAQSLANFIPDEKQVLGVHPSPLSANRGFFGSKPFSEVNRKLTAMGIAGINWKI